MSKTIAKGEELANSGNPLEDDSQVIFGKMYDQQRWAMNQPTSSSPTRNAEESAFQFSQELEGPLFSLDDAESQMLEVPFPQDGEAEELFHHQPNERKSFTAPTANAHTNEVLFVPKLPLGWTIQRDTEQITVFDEQGNECFTYKMSSSSTTQEISQSWYKQFAKGDASQASQTGTQFHTQASGLEDDTAQIDFMKDFTQEKAQAAFSQDPSAFEDAVGDEEMDTQRVFPETPAQPALPKHFNQSHHMVVAPIDMFHQTSPIGQPPTSAESQRPSPDVYSADNITSPEKAPDSSPLARSSSSRLRKPLTTYVAQKSEKHRDAIAVDSRFGSQSTADGFDENSQEIRSRRARAKRARAEKEAAAQYAKVSAPARSRSSSAAKRRSDEELAPKKTAVADAEDETEDEDEEESIPPKPLTIDDDETEDEEEQSVEPPAEVVVPGSTETPGPAGERRRSDADRYIAQTNGTDARDTQQDEIVADSQILPPLPHSPSAIEAPELDFERDSASPEGRSTIPLAELSPNARKPRLQIKGSSLDNQDLVLDTSPSVSRLRTLAEIGGDEPSPIEDDQVSLGDIPGFTQDTQEIEIQNIIRGSSLSATKIEIQNILHSSQVSATKATKTKRKPLAAVVEESVPQVLRTSSLQGPTDLSQGNRVSGVTEVTESPGFIAPDDPDDSADPMVLDTPQSSTQLQANTKEATSVIPNTGAEIESHHEVVGKASRKREKSPVQDRPAKRPKTYGKRSGQRSSSHPKSSHPPSSAQEQQVGVQAGMSPTPEDSDLQTGLDVADTGMNYSTAPEVWRAEAPESSVMNYVSAQSSALSELSESLATPEAFMQSSATPSHGVETEAEEASTVPSGSEVNEQPEHANPNPALSVPQVKTQQDKANVSRPIKNLKRKRATKTPSSSLAQKPVLRNIKTCTNPSTIIAPSTIVAPSNIVAKATPKATPRAVKALKGEAASGTRSSTRRVSSAAGSAKGTPGNAVSLKSTPSTRSSRSSSRASSVRPSTPADTKAAIGKSGKFKTRSGLFSNMTFAVSYVAHVKQKEDVLAKIVKQGGIILEQGFDELFAVDSLPVTPSTSRAQKDADGHLKGLENLKPNTEARSVTFACVIADEHSRKSKYMQALSLDLPCLHGRWIIDCVVQHRILDWTPYLLCSGESSLLDGALHSRLLSSYPAESSNFSEHFESEKRMKLLQGKNVLVIVGTTKVMVDKRKAYVFIIQALGAEIVGTVPDATAARAILETDAGKKWDWVYVDKHEELGQAALNETPRRGGRAKGKKSNKRKSTAIEGDGEDEETSAGSTWLKAKVVGDEFIVQSLILGRLLNDEKPYDDEPAPAMAAGRSVGDKAKGKKTNTKRVKGKAAAAKDDADDSDDTDDEDELS